MKTQHLACIGLVCAVLWCACSGKKYHAEASPADTTSLTKTNTDTAFKEDKLVKTADMHFKVKNVNRTGDDITALIVKYQGIIMHHTVQTLLNSSQDVAVAHDSVIRISSYVTSAGMTIKIPSAQLEDFMNMVGKTAVFVNSRNMDIQDKTLDYLSAQLKLLSRTAITDKQKKGIVKIKDAAQVMDLKDDLIDKQIENKQIDRSVKFSTVTLSFYQSNAIFKEVIVNDDPSNFTLPFGWRLWHAFTNGWKAFADCLVALTNLWVFILAAMGVWAGYKYWKKKKIIAVA